jgi:NADPH:quinone reductase-like Zn-dependent oxidoreductase
MTRQGHTPDVRFPRVLGIECVGEVVQSTGEALPRGASVAAVMGGMGRQYDGGYAEYVVLPNERLMRVDTNLDWSDFAALPEAYLTAHGSLTALGSFGGGTTLLVRGGTSSVGMAAVSLAKARGWVTIATTRNPEKVELLLERGADHAVIDDRSIGRSVREIRSDGPDYILDLVGANTTIDSLHLVASGGTVCVTGTLSGVWHISDFEPGAMIPSGTKLTSYSSHNVKSSEGASVLQAVADGVARGVYYSNLDRVFSLDQISQAHQYMENNLAIGKVVVLV